jgi:hypothetical protein
MKTIRISLLAVCAFAGIAAGYLCAPLLTMWVFQSTEPELFAGSNLALYKNLVVCDCDDRPAEQNAKKLSTYLSTLQELKGKNPESGLLSQETALTYIRLSLAEKKLDQQSQADEDMRRGQSELARLGWKDVSAEHLYLLVSQLNSEYKRPDKTQKNSIAATASH